MSSARVGGPGSAPGLPGVAADQALRSTRPSCWTVRPVEPGSRPWAAVPALLPSQGAVTSPVVPVVSDDVHPVPIEDQAEGVTVQIAPHVHSPTRPNGRLPGHREVRDMADLDRIENSLRLINRQHDMGKRIVDAHPIRLRVIEQARQYGGPVHAFDVHLRHACKPASPRRPLGRTPRPVGTPERDPGRPQLTTSPAGPLGERIVDLAGGVALLTLASVVYGLIGVTSSNRPGPSPGVRLPPGPDGPTG